mmetsp:Transcript_12471/g.19225  ORF Transcript_12471/g.19225 Transcript_12471/m.19225 type:complete len:513 (-) Transcript_12471:48-1586(-)
MNECRFLLILVCIVAITIFVTLKIVNNAQGLVTSRKQQLKQQQRRLEFFDPRTIQEKDGIVSTTATTTAINTIIKDDVISTDTVTNNNVNDNGRIMLQQPEEEQNEKPQPSPSSIISQAIVVLTTERQMYQHASDYLKKQEDAPPFCVPWSLNTDEWWAHHPEWEVYHEGKETYCFRLYANLEKREFFRQLYNNQFPAKCDSQTLYHPTTNSGWGADLDWIGSGLRHGMATGRPFQLLGKDPWHYAAPAKTRKQNPGKAKMTAACPEEDLSCYFLPLSHCPKLDKKVFERQKQQQKDATTTPNKLALRLDSMIQYTRNDITEPGRWYYDYVVRPKGWLRRKVYEMLQSFPLRKKEACTVMHIRRGDTILAEGQRSYHAIWEYLQAGRVEPIILLLTDDANAIREALSSNYSQYDWMYLKRPRHAGTEGGWENHFPSNDATHEVVSLLAEFAIATQSNCTSLIRGPSTFANVLEGHMRQANKNVVVYHLEDETGSNSNNQATLNISTFYSKTE